MKTAAASPTIPLSQPRVNLPRSRWPHVCLSILFLAQGVSLVTSADGPPNVVVILTDDQGWGDLSLHGNTNLATPHIDSLARDGAAFERFFVCPVCSPTRAEFLTGRYHPRLGVYSTSAGGERLNLDETTIAQHFQRAGYATAAFGKWHNGMQYPYHPNGRGFEEFYGFCSGHWGNYFDPVLERNGMLTRGRGFIIDDLTNAAIQFIERHQEVPFFVYLPYNTPHSPMQVPDRWWDKFRDHPLPLRHRDNKEVMEHARAALAMCENIDWNVGRLLARLDELQLNDNTIVVFFHDNGPNGNRWNGDMKGRKGSTDEGGVRSPLLIRWPQRIKPGTKIDRIAGAIDLLPTLTDLAGLTRSPTKPLDGVSLKPQLLGNTDQWADRLLFQSWRGRVSVRSQRYRLDHEGKLFDITNDPGQRRDLRHASEDVAERLLDAAARWRKEVLSEQEDDDDRPFLIGHPDVRHTQLPARDAIAHGQIKRSNRFPNCSYFTNWTTSEDRITWDAEVVADGEFHVDLYYACNSENVGSTIELRFGNARLQTQVTPAHDPPIQGAKNDRFRRVESYVRNFQPLRMGTIVLRRGRGELTLQAIDVAHQQVMDFRLMMLTRVQSSQPEKP